VPFDVDQALTFQPRSTPVDHVRETTDVELCGASATCVGG
jgi:hypothetical protein